MVTIEAGQPPSSKKITEEVYQAKMRIANWEDQVGLIVETVGIRLTEEDFRNRVKIISSFFSRQPSTRFEAIANFITRVSTVEYHGQHGYRILYQRGGVGEGPLAVFQFIEPHASQNPLHKHLSTEAIIPIEGKYQVLTVNGVINLKPLVPYFIEKGILHTSLNPEARKLSYALILRGRY